MEINQPSENHTDPVFNLAISPNFINDNICFAAKASGLYRSTDGGGTWKSVYGSLQLEGSLSTSCVGLSPDFEQSNQVFAAVPGGILRSDDGGVTWTVSLLPTPAPFITSLQLSPQYVEDGTLIAGTLDDGILRSVNRGANWTPWNFGLFDNHVLCVAFSPGYHEDHSIFLGTESGMFMSTNRGMSWREVPFPIELAPVISLALSHQYPHDPKILAGTESSGLFASNDQGENWEKVPENILGMVNGICVLDSNNVSPRVLVMEEQDFLISTRWDRDWQPLHIDVENVGQPTAMAILNMSDGKAMVLSGYSTGQIHRIDIQN
jgi:photosystem II stability/assembly factor-like uncharacterized protein